MERTKLAYRLQACRTADLHAERKHAAEIPVYITNRGWLGSMLLPRNEVSNWRGHVDTSKPTRRGPRTEHAIVLPERRHASLLLFLYGRSDCDWEKANAA